MTSGTIFDIKRYAINDGPGIRTAVFLKGCPLACLWCHNPEGQSSQPQLMFRANRCMASMACIEACPRGAIRWQGESITDWASCDGCGKCAEVCYSGAREMVGRVISVPALLDELKRDIPFYEQSGGGVTFTGGEPMYQAVFLQEALLACKELGLHTVVDTSGYAPWESFEQIRSLVDLFLYDLKLMDEFRHIQFTGVSNRLILENLRKLSGSDVQIIVRLPLIPGVNDDVDNIEAAASFLANLANLDEVEIMPYHEIGVGKYSALGQVYPYKNSQPVLKEDIEVVETILWLHNLPVKPHDFGRHL